VDGVLIDHPKHQITISYPKPWTTMSIELLCPELVHHNLLPLCSTNITHVKKLYTPTVPPLGYPHPSSFPSHQIYSLPGNICNTIRHAARNKGTGVNADSIDLFSSLLKCFIPTITNDLRFVFDLIYKKNYRKTSNDTSQMSTYSAYTKIP
jgi:hypothetical protein